MGKECIKDFHGRILGYVEEQSNGNKVATNFYGKNLGTYYKSENITKNFFGQIVSRGDITSALVVQNNNDNK